MGRLTALDAEQAPVSVEADLRQGGQIGQPFPIRKSQVSLMVVSGAQRFAFLVVPLDRGVFVVDERVAGDLHGLSRIGWAICSATPANIGPSPKFQGNRDVLPVWGLADSISITHQEPPSTLDGVEPVSLS